MSNDAPQPPHATAPEHHALSSSPDHGEVSACSSRSLPPLPHDTSPAGRAPDEGKHPKGKRKRTAVKDKMILEEAYKSNPKPDKQARLEIVDRVSLSEKEVQIWFQNRRQNDRRKSRPLSPEELAALRYGGLPGVSSDSITSGGAVEPDQPYPASDPTAAWAADRTSVSPTFNHNSPDRSQSFAVASTLRHGSQESTMSAQLGKTPPQGEAAPSSQPAQPSETMAHSFSSSVGYLANRWNLGSSFSTPSTFKEGGEESLIHESCPPSSCSSDTGRNANRSRSHVRLSLSLEGKAELVSNQHSPARAAPPRPSSALSGHPQTRRAGLQRSHSALPSITLPPISALTSCLPPRLGRGRSRDVHAWESCADSERRDELTTQAEHESKGSAIAAISLLRSSGILQPSSTKRNASVSRPSQARQAKKTKLGRTSSTYARLENVGAELDKPRESLNGKVKVAMLVSPNDSDKENWSPDEDASSHGRQRRRPLPTDPPSKPQHARRQARVLLDQKRQGLVNSRADTAPSSLGGSAQGAVAIYEDPVKRSREDEVARFMRGEVSPSKKGDMDCVAGLLSLSQGAWR